MIELKLSTIDEIIEGEMAERGHWMVANIKGNYFWPVRKQSYVFKGIKFWIFPLTEKFYPAVTMRLNSPSYADPQSQKLLMEFISALAWSNGCGYMVEGTGGGSLPQPEGISQTFLSMCCEKFDFFNVPETNDRNSLLALALMREGRALNHPGFAFLNFFRILENIFSNDLEARDRWVENNRDKINDNNQKIGIQSDEISKLGGISRYLVDQRNKIAHANGGSIYDPDDFQIWNKFRFDRILMERVAEIAIEDVLKIPITDKLRRKSFISKSIQ